MSLMGEDRLGESFEEIEAAVQETRRGRWFLEELVRRTKSSDTIDIMQAIRKLEMALTVSASNLNASETAFQILSARREIAGIRNDKLPGGGEWPDDRCVFDKLAVQARDCAGALGARIEDLQDVAKSLETGAPSASSTLSEVVESLQSLQANHDLLARRVARLSNLLSQLTLGSPETPQFAPPVATLPGAPPPAPAKEPPKLEAHHLPFFRQDEEIFEAPKDPLPPMPVPVPVAVVERKPALTAIERADEPKGARLIIRRVSASEATETEAAKEIAEAPAPAAAAPPPPPLPEPEAIAPPPKPTNERPRIVIVKSSETPDIPLPGGEASDTAA